MQREGSSTQSTAVDEEIFTQVMGPERPSRVRTFGLGPSLNDVFGGGYRKSQEQSRIIQTQLKEKFRQYREQLEMMDTQISAMHKEMQATVQAQQSTIQTQQARMEHLESKLHAMGGPVAPTTTPSNPLHTPQDIDESSTAAWSQRMPQRQQQSHAFISSFAHQPIPHPQRHSDVLNV